MLLENPVQSPGILRQHLRDTRGGEAAGLDARISAEDFFQNLTGAGLDGLHGLGGGEDREAFLLCVFVFGEGGGEGLEVHGKGGKGGKGDRERLNAGVDRGLRRGGVALRQPPPEA